MSKYWRKDRFEMDVMRVGITKCRVDLFGNPKDSTLNLYYGEKAEPNPKLDRIVKFCQYFHRPVGYYVDLGESFDGTTANFVGDNNIVQSSVNGDCARELQHMREILDMQKQLLESKEAQLNLYKEDAEHWKSRYQELKNSIENIE